MSSIGTIIGSLAALFIIFGESPARIAAAQDQPIKRTSCIGLTSPTLLAKKRSSILPMSCRVPKAGGIPTMAMSTSMYSKARSS